MLWTSSLDCLKCVRMPTTIQALRRKRAIRARAIRARSRFKPAHKHQRASQATFAQTSLISWFRFVLYVCLCAHVCGRLGVCSVLLLSTGFNADGFWVMWRLWLRLSQFGVLGSKFRLFLRRHRTLDMVMGQVMGLGGLESSAWGLRFCSCS